MRYKKTYLPQEVTGYELDPQGGMFSIILNEETENIFVNPSAEHTMDEFIPRQAAVVYKTTAKQSRGAASAGCLTTNNRNDGVYKEKAISTAGTYTFSVDVWGIANIEYEIMICNTSWIPLVRKTFKSLRRWVRPHVTAYLEVSGGSTNYRFAVIQKTPRSHTFYTDGYQLENKRYPTTYCDGDMEGYVIGEKAYRWTGMKHNSSTIRASSTRSGGREIFLKDLGFYTTKITGLGATPVNVFSKEITSGGNFYIGSNYAERPFTIIGTMFAEQGSMQLLQNRKRLERVVDFSRTPYAQEILLRYRPDGDRNSTPYEVKCHYVSGLEGDITQEYRENVALQFAQSEPFVTNGLSEAADINYTHIALPVSVNGTFGNIVRSKDLHLTSLMSSDTSVITNGIVEDATFDHKNGIYIAGSFTTVNGVSCNRFGFWNGTVWSGCAGGVPDGQVNAVLELPNGLVLIGGTFTSAQGKASCAYLTLYNPLTEIYSPYGSPNGYINDIFYLNGYVYVVGGFTNISSAGISFVARAAYNTGSFASMGTLTEPPQKIVGYTAGNDTHILVGIGGADRNVKRNSNFTSWVDVHTPTGSISNYEIRDMVIHGATVYFTEFIGRGGGIYEEYIWKLNPSTESVVAYGEAPFTQFRHLCAMSDGGLAFTHDYGFYTDAAFQNFLHYPFGYSMFYPDKQFYPGEFASYDWNSITSAPVNLIVENHNNPGELFICARTAFSTLKTVNNTGNTTSYPIFTFTGNSNLYWIKNLTTNQYLYFNDLEIGQEETVKVYNSSSGVKVLSDVRGDISGKLNGGFSSVITLAPGNNDIAIIFTKYWPLNGGLRLYVIGANESNTLGGITFATLEGDSSNHRWSFYKDIARTQLVGRTPYHDGGYAQTIYEQNDSGFTGWLSEEQSFASFVSASASLSPSSSVSPSVSPSRSPSPSASLSTSPSASASISPSRSPSPSASQSRSNSPSLSPSRSPSPSASVSASVSPSPSNQVHYVWRLGSATITWIGQHSSITGLL